MKQHRRRVEVAAVGGLVALGGVLRLWTTATATAENDAPVYAELARRMSWLDPFEASFREPGWVAMVKVAGTVVGYTAQAAQVIGLLWSLVGLVLAAVVLWRLLPSWVALPAVALLAVDERLIGEAGSGGREAVGLATVAAALLVVAYRPAWLPLIATWALLFRWELGITLWAVVVVLFVLGRRVPVRWIGAGALAAVVLVGPFMVNNARTFGDPMFHSSIHATYNRNVEAYGYEDMEPLGDGEALHDLLDNPRWRGPLVSWGEYAVDLGPGELAFREAWTFYRLPANVLVFGRFPGWFAYGLVVLAVAGVWLGRRRPVMLAAAVIVTLGVAGYGLIFPPYLDRRLAGYLALPLLLAVGEAVRRLQAPLVGQVRTDLGAEAGAEGGGAHDDLADHAVQVQ